MDGFSVDTERLSAAAAPLEALGVDLEGRAGPAQGMLNAAGSAAGQVTLDSELHAAAVAVHDALDSGAQQIRAVAAQLVATARNYAAADTASTARHR